MRVFVASDLHGSEYYCEKMLEAYTQEKCDKLIFLGDILYHGPRNELPEEYAPKQVTKLLNAVSDEILAVRGNCDAEVDQMVLNFACMAEYAVLYVKKKMIYLTHGHIYNENNLPKLKEGDILLHGHTHVPMCKKINYGKNIYINPGSVSIPKENSHHGYLIIDDEKKPVIEWKNFSSDVIMTYDI